MNIGKIRLSLSFLLLFGIVNNSFGMRQESVRDRIALDDNPFRFFVTGRTNSNQVRLYDEYGECLRSKEIGERDVSSCELPVAFSPDGSLFAAFYKSGLITRHTTLMRTMDLRRIGKFLDFPGVKALAFSADNRKIAFFAACSDERVIKVYSISDQRGKLRQEIASISINEEDLEHASCMAFDRQNSDILWIVLSSSSDSKFVCMTGVELSSGNQVYLENINTSSAYGKISCFDDGRVLLAVIGRKGTRIKVIDINRESNRRSPVIKRIPGYDDELSSFDFCPNTHLLYHFRRSSLSQEGREIDMINCDSGQKSSVAIINGIAKSERCIAFCFPSDSARKDVAQAILKKRETKSRRELQENYRRFKLECLQYFVSQTECMPDAIRLYAGQSTIHIPKAFLLNYV